MIDWYATERQFGLTRETCKKGSRVAVICDRCSATGDVGIRRKGDAVADIMPWRCKQCQVEAARPKLVESSRRIKNAAESKTRQAEVQGAPEYRDNQRAKALQRYRDQDYRDRVAAANRTSLARPEVRQRLSASTTAAWQDVAKSAAMLAGIKSVEWTEEKRQLAAVKTKACWRSNTYRAAVLTGISERTKRLWADPAYRARTVTGCRLKMGTTEIRTKLSAENRRRWQHEGFRHKLISSLQITTSSTEYRSKLSAASKAKWADPAYRARQVARCNTEEHRAKMAAIRASIPMVSKTQQTIYSLLDDLGVRYYREYNDRPDDPECTIGPYSFDCVIPRNGRPALLLEVQGDYWHSRAGAAARDTRKQSYIQNNLSHLYELKHIWEHELLCGDRVAETLKYWLGLGEPELIPYRLAELAVRPAPASDYRPLLAKYHYLVSAGAGGEALGAYLGKTLVAVAVFSRLPRNNLPYNYVSSRELSRLCVHPAYRQQNLISWFLARAIRQLPDRVDKIISYCDTTFNHTGATYRACNFRLDGDTPRDYWYVNQAGWVMHKRTLYNQAVKCHQTEAEYAGRFGYSKVWGEKKLRFILDR